MISCMTHGGVPLDQYHGGLLTVLVVVWMLWGWLGYRFGSPVILVAVVTTVAGTAIEPFVGLIAAAWLISAIIGDHLRR